MENRNSDIIAAFEEMLKIETSMESVYRQIIELAEDETTRKIIEKIMHDEMKHEKNVKKILEIIGE